VGTSPMVGVEIREGLERLLKVIEGQAERFCCVNWVCLNKRHKSPIEFHADNRKSQYAHTLQ
jgi:hypothetical protein